MSLYIDLTEFLECPIKTGIQRIAGEICRYLPPDSAIPVRLHSDRYVALPTCLIQAVGTYFRTGTRSGTNEIHRLAQVENAQPIRISTSDTVLVPELFYEPERVAFFRQMSDDEFERCRFVVYDLLTATHPQFFHPCMAQDLVYGYFQVIRRAINCGFISEYTRDVYYGRLKRTANRGGVVLPLGCDALGPRPNRPQLNRPLTFTVLSTIEPRKNHALVLEAFEPLLSHFEEMNLCFLGKGGRVDADWDRFVESIEMLAAKKGSRFRFLSAPDDGTLRHYIERSRATIYVSAAEGYGLPPVESLWCGIPVIASTAIPSLNRLGSACIHYVEPLNVVNLRNAVLSFVDNGYADRKAEEAMQLNLPTWQSFSQEVLRWCGGN